MGAEPLRIGYFLRLDADRAFRVAIDLGDPDFIVAALDPCGTSSPGTLPTSWAAVRSRSPMIRALGAQSLVAPRGRHLQSSTNVRHRLSSSAKRVAPSNVLDRPTAALCSSREWGLQL